MPDHTKPYPEIIPLPVRFRRCLLYTSILSVSADDNVKGLSYASYGQGTMFHIDCQKKLVEHATHFVEQYAKFPTEINRRDAVSFTALLKNSPQKEALLKRIKMCIRDSKRSCESRNPPTYRTDIGGIDACNA